MGKLLASHWLSLPETRPRIGDVVTLYATHGQVVQKTFQESDIKGWYSHWSATTIQHPEFFPNGRFTVRLHPMADSPEKGSEVLLLARLSDGIQFVQAVAGRMLHGFGLPNCSGWECVTLDEDRLLGWVDLRHKRPSGAAFEFGPADAPWRCQDS